LTGYNVAAAMYLGLHKKSEHAWQLLRDRLVPAIGDLFEQPEEPVVESLAQAPAEHATGTAQPEPAQPAHTPAAPPATQPAMVNGRISLGGLRRGGS
jgi:hypothetical protein